METQKSGTGDRSRSGDWPCDCAGKALPWRQMPAHTQGSKAVVEQIRHSGERHRLLRLISRIHPAPRQIVNATLDGLERFGLRMLKARGGEKLD